MEQFSPGTASYKAYAKINLSLEILKKRADGFHELATVMQTIGLYDVITITPANDLQFDSNLPELVDEHNLVWRAALILLETCGEVQGRGANIFLEKQIPVAAGMGGGSSDAAATLLALNSLWNLNLTEDKLLELAARLGSDVPFLLGGGTALAEGRGERITRLPPLQPAWLALLYPQIALPENKTAQIYKMLDYNDYSSGGVTRALVGSIRRGERPSQSLLHNSFERVVYERFPSMDNYRQAMVDTGAEHVRVSGSGPSIYTLLEHEDEAQAIVNRLIQQGFVAYALPTVTPEEKIF